MPTPCHYSRTPSKLAPTPKDIPLRRSGEAGERLRFDPQHGRRLRRAGPKHVQDECRLLPDPAGERKRQRTDLQAYQTAQEEGCEWRSPGLLHGLDHPQNPRAVGHQPATRCEVAEWINRGQAISAASATIDWRRVIMTKSGSAIIPPFGSRANAAMARSMPRQRRKWFRRRPSADRTSLCVPKIGFEAETR
jgi:hypothetical protein